METTHWMNDGQAGRVLQREEQGGSVDAELMNEMATDDDYAGAIGRQYAQDVDNVLAGFDEYLMPGNWRAGYTSKMNTKKDTSLACPLDDLRQKQALPIFRLKMEHETGVDRPCCNVFPPATVIQNRIHMKSGELSLDTSFSPTSDLGSSCSGSPAVDSPDCGIVFGTETGFEVYHDLIMRHLIQDIQSTCERLNISRDPKTWTRSDSVAWLTDMAAQYQLTQVPIDKLGVDGPSLCSMNLGQFIQCFPNGGETVHAQLQIWNSANEYCSRQNSVNSVPLSPDEPLERNVNGDERHHQQFVQLNPGSVIQRLRTAADNGPNGLQYSLALPLHQQHQHSDPFPNLDHASSSVSNGFGIMLSSPGSCMDNGPAMDGDYLAMNMNDSDTEISGAISTSGNGSNIHLWQFLRELLEQHEKYGHCLRWIDQSSGIFKIEDSHALARLWGKRKNRPAMNYDKLSRSLRQYYKKNILKKTTRSQRLVYQFLHPYHMC